MINDKPLKQGKYALLTIPGEKKWELHIFEYSSPNWLSYLELIPILKIESTPSVLMTPRESLLIYFDELKLQSAELVVEWDRTKLSFTIELDEHQEIMADIKRKTAGPSLFELYSAALYLHESQTDLPLALSFIQQVTQKDSALFFMVYREALILRDLNRNKEALKAAQRSKDLSAQAGNDDFVRLNEKLIQSLSG